MPQREPQKCVQPMASGLIPGQLPRGGAAGTAGVGRGRSPVGPEPNAGLEESLEEEDGLW